MTLAPPPAAWAAIGATPMVSGTASAIAATAFRTATAMLSAVVTLSPVHRPASGTPRCLPRRIGQDCGNRTARNRYAPAGSRLHQPLPPAAPRIGRLLGHCADIFVGRRRGGEA